MEKKEFPYWLRGALIGIFSGIAVAFYAFFRLTEGSRSSLSWESDSNIILGIIIVSFLFGFIIPFISGIVIGRVKEAEKYVSDPSILGKNNKSGDVLFYDRWSKEYWTDLIKLGLVPFLLFLFWIVSYYVFGKNDNTSPWIAVILFLGPISLFFLYTGITIVFMKKYIVKTGKVYWTPIVTGKRAKRAGIILTIFGILFLIATAVISYFAYLYPNGVLY